MKIKEERPIFFRVFTAVALILLINMGLFVYNNKDTIKFNEGVTGFSVREIFLDNAEKMNPLSRGLLIAQWALLGLLLFFTAFKDSRLKKEKTGLKDIIINPSKEQTDLDKMYDILKNKKQLRIKDISRMFHVENEIAMGWAKILESGDLVEIDYPLFGGPVINYNEERIKREDKKNESDVKGVEGNEGKEIIEEGKIGEKKKNKKSIGGLVLTLLFLITFGLAAYPFYLMINNNWDLVIIRSDISAFVLSLLFLLSFVIFLIALIRFMFRKKEVEIKEINNNDKQTDKRKDLKIEKNVEIKREGRVEIKGKDKNRSGIFILLLFLVNLGLGVYPAFWLINNNWNFAGLRYDRVALIVSALFALFVFVFLIALMRFMFRKKKVRLEIKKKVNKGKRMKVKSKKKRGK